MKNTVLKTACGALILFIILLYSPVYASLKRFKNDSDLSHWFMTYYKNPEPELVIQAIKEASKQKISTDQEKYPPLIGFIAGINKNNPEIVVELARSITYFPEDNQIALIYMVCLSGNSEARQILNSLIKSDIKQKKYIDYLLNGPQYDIFDLSLKSGPSLLDMYWGYFFATGDEYPVIQIISTLAWLNKPEKSSRDYLHIRLIAEAAKWSLTSLSVQDDRVFAICQQQLALQPEKIKLFLEEIVAEAKEARDAATETGIPSD